VSFAEAAIVLDLGGRVTLSHLPPGRSAVSLPDSTYLWDHIWRTRLHVGGVAHLHPGSGEPHPSREDVTTFAAIERGIGRRLRWWISSADMTVRLEWGTYAHGYVTRELWRFRDGEPPWVHFLRGLGDDRTRVSTKETDQ
jgi:hypothetical protein